MKKYNDSTERMNDVKRIGHSFCKCNYEFMTSYRNAKGNLNDVKELKKDAKRNEKPVTR